MIAAERLTVTHGLSDKLLPHVTPERLAENYANYPEVKQGLGDDEPGRLQAIREQLLRVPLIHSTKQLASAESIQERGILPYVSKPEHLRGTTEALDENLGLSEYGFLHWGAAEKSSYGRFHVLVEANVLQRDTTIVTPADITAFAFDLTRPFSRQSPEVQQTIQREYFGKMVRGTDWLDIIARRVYGQIGQTDSGLIPLERQAQFGEIKVHGGIDKSDIQRIVGPDDEHDYWRSLLDKGFMPGPVYRAVQYHMGGYDVTPEQLGASTEAGSRVWRSILGIKA